MAHSILVITATQGFGELIEQTLNETGLYRVTLVQQAEEAFKKAETQVFQLAILDEECDNRLGESVMGLRGLFPDIAIVVIPLNTEPCSDYAGLDIQGTLSKPFYLPDLLETVHRILKHMPSQKGLVQLVEGHELKNVPAATQADRAISVEWLQDAARAAQHLTSLSLESSALAALIVRDCKLWSYAGQLPQPAAQEITMMIANYWSQGITLPPGSKLEGKSDLARFIRLESTGGEYMLYATELAGVMVLALVFEAETPFGKIRAQVNRLARAFSSPLDTTPKAPEAGPMPEETQPVSPPEVLPVKAPEQGSRPDSTQIPDAPAASIATPPVEDVEEDLPPDLPPLWEDVPPPDPAGGQSKPKAPPIPTDARTVIHPVRALPYQWIKEAEVKVDLEQKPEPKADLQDTASSFPPMEPSAEVQAAALTGFQPVSQALCQITYTCVLLPRMPKHQITGDLAEKLSIWMGELCMAFNWRLEHIVLAADYLQWVVNVPPSTSPGYHMRTIRQHTSHRIFLTFPDLECENPSGDFWSPGYLIMSSSQPPPDDIIKDFIQQVRQHQGASQPFSPYSRGR